jgi:hypothetical protein
MGISAATVTQINFGGYSGNMIAVPGTQGGDGATNGDDCDTAAGTTRS